MLWRFLPFESLEDSSFLLRDGGKSASCDRGRSGRVELEDPPAPSSRVVHFGDSAGEDGALGGICSFLDSSMSFRRAEEILRF